MLKLSIFDFFQQITTTHRRVKKKKSNIKVNKTAILMAIQCLKKFSSFVNCSNHNNCVSSAFAFLATNYSLLFKKYINSKCFKGKPQTTLRISYEPDDSNQICIFIRWTFSDQIFCDEKTWIGHRLKCAENWIQKHNLHLYNSHIIEAHYGWETYAYTNPYIWLDISQHSS